MSRTLLQQALDALKLGGLIKKTQAIAALEAELAKPEQDINNLHIGTDVIEEGMHLIVRRGNEIIHSQFYEAPKRKWVGLTDEEIKNIMQRWRNGYIDIKDVEQLLKEKNT